MKQQPRYHLYFITRCSKPFPPQRSLQHGVVVRGKQTITPHVLFKAILGIGVVHRTRQTVQQIHSDVVLLSTVLMYR
jgi:hypothetical protein